MTIVNDPENQRVVDTETEEYMTWRTVDRENRISSFVIHSKNGAGLLGSEVRRLGISESNDGIATLARHELLKTWIPSGRPEPPTYFVGDHDMIAKLEAFLRIKMHYGGVKNPYPRFEFVDLREAQEAA